ncbi:hypothetical protein pb186bvf_012756 [Paramecium bursaria]
MMCFSCLVEFNHEQWRMDITKSQIRVTKSSATLSFKISLKLKIQWIVTHSRLTGLIIEQKRFDTDYAQDIKKTLDGYVMYTNFYEMYQIGKQIGRGGYSKVFEITNKLNQQQLAVKMVSHQRQLKDLILAEVQMVKQLNHKNVVKIKEVYEDEQMILIVMEKLSKIFIQLENTNEIRSILKNILEGLDYIHSHNIIHRDLKPSNIMMDKNGEAVIIDFGLSIYQQDKRMQDLVGTPGYLAPERFSYQDYDNKVDMFSLGVIAYELYKCKNFFFKTDNPALHFDQTYLEDTLKNAQLPEDLYDLIANLMDQNPQLRLSADQGIDHPFFDHTDIMKLSKISEPKFISYLENQNSPNL